MPRPWNHSLSPIAAFVALFLAFSTPLSARGQFWDFLGCTNVDGSQNHGRIPITRNGLFHTIQLRVRGDAIFFDRLIVHFADGGSEEFVVSNRISPEGKDYIVGLRGEGRVLESVELWYYRESWGHKPRVSLYGGIHSPESDSQNFAQKQ